MHILQQVAFQCYTQKGLQLLQVLSSFKSINNRWYSCLWKYIPLDNMLSLLECDGPIGMSLLSLPPTVIGVNNTKFVVGPSGAHDHTIMAIRNSANLILHLLHLQDNVVHTHITHFHNNSQKHSPPTAPSPVSHVDGTPQSLVSPAFSLPPP